jgi:hypothetical protein
MRRSKRFGEIHLFVEPPKASSNSTRLPLAGSRAAVMIFGIEPVAGSALAVTSLGRGAEGNLAGIGSRSTMIVGRATATGLRCQGQTQSFVERAWHVRRAPNDLDDERAKFSRLGVVPGGIENARARRCRYAVFASVHNFATGEIDHQPRAPIVLRVA